MAGSETGHCESGEPKFIPIHALSLVYLYLAKILKFPKNPIPKTGKPDLAFSLD